MKKWQEEYIKEIEGLSNEGLLDRTISDNQPDDWDGIFTNRGEWMASTSLKMLTDRLKAAKWIE